MTRRGALVSLLMVSATVAVDKIKNIPLDRDVPAFTAADRDGFVFAYDLTRLRAIRVRNGDHIVVITKDELWEALSNLGKSGE